MPATFLDSLRAHPILADGAMGTLLYLRGAANDQCLDQLNATRPELVQGVHRDYISAGASLVETNTFGANRVKLARFGLADQVRDLNRRAVRLAREAREIAGREVWVAGSLGPLTRPGSRREEVSTAESRAAFHEQVEALLEGGADLLLFETFWDLEQLTLALETARTVCKLPVVAQMSFTEDGLLLKGQTPEQVVRRLEEAGADVVGANCSLGPHGILEVLERMASATRLPLSAMPNAGLPQLVDGRVVYVASPDYFGEYAARFLSVGARLQGGCCGTTPSHVAAMSRALLKGTDGPPVREVPDVPVEVLSEPEPVAEAAGPRGFAQKLGREFVISVELDPPRGLAPGKLLKAAELMKAEGVDAVNIADSPMARVRMGAASLAFLIETHVGIETILHFTCRDRNLMGIQSDLIGAHAVGIRNILALTGDPPSLGDYAQATAVYDVDSIGLLRILRKLNEGVDINGTSIGSCAQFRIGCAVNPASEDLEEELRRFRAKLEAGAEYAMTQPLYEMDTWRRFRKHLGPVNIPILYGVLPLHSSRHAEFLHHEVPGISIPEWARERMRQAGPDGQAEGARMATELLREAREEVDGVYLMPSFGRYEQIVEVVRAARKQDLPA